MTSPIIILAGPTASGKSKLALDIAGKIDAVIINADSKQVYSEIPIITAQPSEEDRDNIPHELYGVCSVSQHCTVATWLEQVAPVIKTVLANGQVPLLVGGTGLYIRALMHGLSPIPDIDKEVKRTSSELLEAEGSEGLHAALAAVDPVMAERLEMQDVQRVLRAYEVVVSSGTSLAEWQLIRGETHFSPEQFKLFFLLPERESVYMRCNQRFVNMVDQGVVDEIKALQQMHLDPGLPAMKAHGVPELLLYLDGKMTLDDAIDQAQKNTRHYIKRQFTWFRHQMPEAVSLTSNNTATVMDLL